MDIEKKKKKSFCERNLLQNIPTCHVSRTVSVMVVATDKKMRKTLLTLFLDREIYTSRQ